MKRRILSGILSVAMLLGLVLSSFPGVFAGEVVFKSWNVATSIKEDLKAATDAATAELEEGEELTGAMVAAKLEFGVISYKPNHYGSTGIGTAYYRTDGFCDINTSNHTQVWRAQMQIPNNQGTGEGYNNRGVIIRTVVPTDSQYVTFTAPVDGVYNFVPKSVGGASSIEESVSAITGGMIVEVLVKGESKGIVTVDRDETTEDIGEKADLPALSDLELNAGDKIELKFNPTAFSDASNAANAVSVNFDVEITDEIAPQVLVTDLETASYNLVEEYQLTSTSAAVPAPNGIFAVGYADVTGQSGAVLDTLSKAALYHEANGYTWYYGKYGGDDSYGIMVDADDNTISFSSKYQCQHGFVITADKTGIYHLTSGAITKGGAGAMNLIVEDNAGNKLYNNGGNSDGLDIKVEMKKGEKLYIFADRTQTNWQTASITISGLNLDVTYTTKITPAVYEENEYVVADELLNNTGSWDTAYQDPSGFTYDGFLTPVAYDSGNGAFIDAFCRIYADRDGFSNTNQSYENNTMYAYTDGSMRWVYDYGSNRMGFKFTATADAEYVLTSDVFADAGINAYVYSVAEDGTLTQVGNATPVSTDSGLNVVVKATEGETYAIVLGKSSGGWNAKRDCTTSWMKLTEKVIVTPEKEEDIVLEYVEDPNYVYQYEKEDLKVSVSADKTEVNNGEEVEFTVLVNNCFFGYNGFTMTLPYDDAKLELVSVEGTAVLTGDVNTNLESNPATVLYLSAEGQNIEGKGEILKIKFTVKDIDADAEVSVAPTFAFYRATEDGADVEDVDASLVTVVGETVLLKSCSHENFDAETAEWVVIDEGDCLTHKKLAQKCPDCDEIMAVTDSNEYGDHAWSDWSETIPAGCETPGEKTRVCANDETHVETIPTEALGHAYGDWIVDTHPTWASEGSKHKECANECGIDIVEPIPAATVASVEITKMPTKLSYTIEDGVSSVAFDTTGMEITVTYSDYDVPTVITDFAGVEFPEVDISEETDAQEIKFTVAGTELTVTVSVQGGKLGDYDGNGATNIIDVQQIFVQVANGFGGDIAAAIGDFDGNGTVNIIDVQQLFVAVANGQIS